MASPDPLFSVRNNFYLGAYQTAISDASSLTGLSEDQKLERDTFVYRSYVELGSYEVRGPAIPFPCAPLSPSFSQPHPSRPPPTVRPQMVLSEIPTDAPPPLAAVRQLASYHKAGPSPSSPVPDALEAGLSDGALSSDPTYLYVTALVRFLRGDAAGALRLAGPARTLELLALSVQVMLSLHRPDAAERQLRAMAAIDDDATLTQLAGAWVALAAGGPRVREAASIYQELGDRFAWTPRLHAGLASAQACMGRWEEAEAELLQAVEKNPKDPDSLANLAVVSLHLGKPAGRYLGCAGWTAAWEGGEGRLRAVLCRPEGEGPSECGPVRRTTRAPEPEGTAPSTRRVLKDVAPSHALLERRAAAEEAFDRAASGITA